MAAGYKAIEVHCDEPSVPVVTRAFDLVGQRVPGLMRDGRVVEEWESLCGEKYTPRYWVRLFPDKQSEAWDSVPTNAELYPIHSYFTEEDTE